VIGAMDVEFHQLDRRLGHLRVRSPQRQRHLLASLAEVGQQTPIVVVAAEEPKRYLVIDGHKRVAALERLGRDTVCAVVWPMSEAEALLLERSLRLSEQETALEQGWLLAELEQRFGWGLEELGRRFDRDVSWVSRRLALVEILPQSIQQQVREGKIAPHVAMKVLVPMARANIEHCEQMAAALAAHRWSTRQAAELYAAWRDGSPALRERLLDQPALFLKARNELNASPPTDAVSEELMRDLEIVSAVLRRAGQRVDQGEIDQGQCEQARRRIESIGRQLADLAVQVERSEQRHAQQRTTNDHSGAACPAGEQRGDRPAAGDLEAHSTQSGAGGKRRVARDRPSGEGHGLPATDPGAAGLMQGQSRASP
jgi:ParB family transcriptional regulator, chromosome partitioning protein